MQSNADSTRAPTERTPRRARRLPARLTALLVLLALAGCNNPPQRFDARFMAMGTLVDVTLYGVSTERGNELVRVLEQHFEDWDKAWDPWEGNGLARVNRALDRGESAPIDGELTTMLERARRIEVRSGHRFDPAIGALVRLWGFDRGKPEDARPPAADRIRRLLDQRPRLTDLRLADGRVSTANPAVRIDLGGFAKGYAVGRALSLLRERGVDNAIVNAGGDLAAIGRPGERRWRIGIRAPRGEGLLAAVDIDGGETVFTSGDYERFFVYEGRRYHHILDPRTGMPARGVRSVTILGTDPALADAAATALFVAGPQHWITVARKLGVRYVMLVDDDGIVHMNPAMAKRVRFQGDAPRVRRSEPL